MRRRIFTWLFWIAAALFIVPSAALVLLIGLDAVMECELNPWAGFTCPRWAAPIVALSLPGALTIVPTVIVGVIWGGVALYTRLAGPAEED